MKNIQNKKYIFQCIIAIIVISMMLVSCQSAAPASDATASGETSQTDEQTDDASTGEEGAEIASSQANEVSPTPGIPSELVVDVDDLDGVEIRFWHPWVDNMDDIVQELATEFNQTNEWGILVDVAAPGSSGEVYEQIRVAMEKESEKSMMEGAGVSPSSGKTYLHATGTLDYGLPPDVFVAPMDHILSLEENGMDIVDLSSYLQYPELGFTDQDKADFPAVFWNYARVGEKLYGIPAERSAYVLVYNSTWGQELGFSKPPATIEEFKEQVCAAAEFNNELAKEDGNTDPEAFIWEDQLRKVGTGGWIVNMNAPETLSWIMAYGDLSIPDETGDSYQFDTDETMAAFQLIQELYDEGCAWTSRNPDPYEYFANRQTLMYSGSMPDILTQERIFNMMFAPEDEEGEEETNGEGSQVETNEDIITDEWTVIPYPTLDGNPKILVNSLTYGVFKTSSERQLASWLFIRWLSQPENVAALVEGNGTIPVRVSANDLLNDYATQYPQWEKTLGWVPMTFYTPPLSSWRVAGNILQDGAWHIFEATLPDDQISEVLSQIDEMIPEVEEEME